jgi:hypothetical protein
MQCSELGCVITDLADPPHADVLLWLILHLILPNILYTFGEYEVEHAGVSCTQAGIPSKYLSMQPGGYKSLPRWLGHILQRMSKRFIAATTHIVPSRG